MEPKDKFSTVHEEFFGNIVGTIVQTIKTITPRQTLDFIADWSIPTPAPTPSHS
ncbi:hypothetical protein [Duncaniella sp.]|uniref:hypothetical protein n=1 Tax=Duncaniella sp. TaxID=2518496 RepID=UPI0023D1A888|nr:hypothetical protein [Duncaniella sp.]MDE5689928.1 hypothetical protein [Duncaniella sp.]MDE5904269.1 hypothetical protein [Duncaniella sp.]MDE7147347.1 hypothetical protein [Duncaniella sp.]